MLKRSPDKPRFSLPETALVVIVGAALVAGIYGITNLLLRNDRADNALTTLAYLEQNPQSPEVDPMDPWGNPIAVVSTEQNFSVTFAAVPPTACKHMAKHFDRASASYISLSINSVMFREGAEEFNSQTIARACNEKENAMMIWTFSLLVEPA